MLHKRAPLLSHHSFASAQVLSTLQPPRFKADSPHTEVLPNVRALVHPKSSQLELLIDEGVAPEGNMSILKFIIALEDTRISSEIVSAKSTSPSRLRGAENCIVRETPKSIVSSSVGLRLGEIGYEVGAGIVGVRIGSGVGAGTGDEVGAGIGDSDGARIGDGVGAGIGN